MYPHATALAKQLNAALVFFDIEHTGNSGAKRGITEFGAVRVSPEGVVSEFSSLVKPPAECEFNPYVMRLTGIKPLTVAKAPAWKFVQDEFVVPNQSSVWIGFNSRSSDMPIVRAECLRNGFKLPDMLHLDLMRVGELKGSLTDRVSALNPNADVSGAHRALADAWYTLHLLEGLVTSGLPLGQQIAKGALSLQCSAASDPGKQLKKPSEKVVFDGSFLVKGESSRHGAKWTESESLWLIRMGRKGKTPEELATLIGRTPFAVACRLFREKLMDESTFHQYRTSNLA